MMLVRHMEAAMGTLHQSQSSAVKAGQMAILGTFVRRLYARRIERAQMRFAPAMRMGFCND
jgi:hypothetical protein